jgi:glycosyltransferase involved in cell wall biosynthesis
VSMDTSERLPGISFVVRIRNEERTLGQSLESLRGLTIPHEIIPILHMCTDRSKEIVESAGFRSSLEYHLPVSRAGYETLVTSDSSAFSLVTYYNWCFEQARHLWCFKWDADFVASSELIDFLNSRPWSDPTPTRIRVPTITPGAKPNPEPYLFNAGRRYAKWVFWEYNASIFAKHVREEVRPENIEHASPLDEPSIKDYWRGPPWFQHHESAEAEELSRRYGVLSKMFGREPVGLARAVNPACDALYLAIRQKEEELRTLGIELWR